MKKIASVTRIRGFSTRRGEFRHSYNGTGQRNQSYQDSRYPDNRMDYSKLDVYWQ